jgi:hypothetical protein
VQLLTVVPMVNSVHANLSASVDIARGNCGKIAITKSLRSPRGEIAKTPSCFLSLFLLGLFPTLLILSPIKLKLKFFWK